MDNESVLEYIRAKAERYVEVGPEGYRKEDHFGMPEEDTPSDVLDAISAGMKQLAEGKGAQPDCPLKGIEISGFYALLRTLHFEFAEQSLIKQTDEYLLDEMHMKHAVMFSMDVVLYNRVSKRS